MTGNVKKRNRAIQDDDESNSSLDTLIAQMHSSSTDNQEVVDATLIDSVVSEDKHDDENQEPSPGTVKASNVPKPDESREKLHHPKIQNRKGINRQSYLEKQQEQSRKRLLVGGILIEK